MKKKIAKAKKSPAAPRVNAKEAKRVQKSLSAGSEPVWNLDPAESDNALIQSEMHRCLNWYSVAWKNTQSSAKAAFIEYFQSIGTPARTLIQLKAVDEQHFCSSVAVIARMIACGQSLPESITGKLAVESKRLLAIASKVNIPEASDNDVGNPPVGFRERLESGIESKTHEYLAMIEEETDKFLDSYESKFSTYDFLVAHSIKGVYLPRIASWFQAVIDELEVVESGADEDLTEAYSTTSSDELLKYKAFLMGIIADCNRWEIDLKRIAKPKKKTKKVISAAKRKRELNKKLKLKKANAKVKGVKKTKAKKPVNDTVDEEVECRDQCEMNIIAPPMDNGPAPRAMKRPRAKRTDSGLERGW